MGMYYMEIAIIALLIASIAFQFFSLRIQARMLRESIAALDYSIAEALKTTVENLPDALRNQLMPEVEPINPVQQIIAQMLQQKLNAPIEATVIPSRSPDGKFESDTSS